MRMMTIAALAALMATGAQAQDRQMTNVLLRPCSDASDLLREVPTEGPESTEYIMVKSFVIGVWASIGPSMGTNNDAEAVFHDVCQEFPEKTAVEVGRQIGVINETGN